MADEETTEREPAKEAPAKKPAKPDVSKPKNSSSATAPKLAAQVGIGSKTSAANAKKLIFTAVIIAMLIASAEDIANGKAPDVKIFIGGAFVLVVLLAAADASPNTAKAFGLMVLVTAVFVRGGNAYAAITKALNNKTEVSHNSASVTKFESGNTRVNQQGQPDANGQFSLQPGTKPGTTNIVPLIP